MPSSKLSTRRLALISGCAFLGLLGAVSVCDAQSLWRRRVPPVATPAYRVSLEDIDGSLLPTFQHSGTTFVLGEPGERYNIRVHNPTSERVEAVVSVDGRDAVSGEVGDYVSQRGYLIEPWGSLLVEGFRRSLQEVAAFRFAEQGRSYSARRGTPEHVGVIGVAIFPERTRPPLPVQRPTSRYRSDDDYRAAPPSAPGESEESRAETSRAPRDRATPRKRGAAASSSPSAGPSNIGTEYGESRSSDVVEVAFERRTPTRPSAVLKLRYDDHAGLEARGIDLSYLGYAYAEQLQPEPFPQNRRFAPPPR